MEPVLVVEDDDDIRESLALLLEEEGYQPVPAATLAQAHALLDTQTFALILTDLFATSRSGALQSVVALARHGHPTPVGVLTGWTLPEDQVQEVRFAFIMSKPFDVEALIANIAAAIHVALTPAEQLLVPTVHAYFDRLSARDWDGLAALCVDDVTYVLPGAAPFSITLQGRDAFRAYTEETFRHFPAAHFTDIHVYATPHGLAARYQASWEAGPQGTQGQAGAVVFQFCGNQISQIGVRLNDERLRALMSAE